ncbi:HNH endonuclease [Candidatus Accumulibacter sp. ACC012]|uniref:HNH endonuclease n=1 Tax=Candidatus Accumulibacter sp. ACC012 TaxID=2823332 RepID=UPI00342F7E2A
MPPGCLRPPPWSCSGRFGRRDCRHGSSCAHYQRARWPLRARATKRVDNFGGPVLIFSDELPVGISYPEGLAHSSVVSAYERNAEARAACIEHYKPLCRVCGIDFGVTYGEVGSGFIHVHHRVRIATIAKVYNVNPVNDLVPVCPNCHAMLHRRDPPYSVD